jgi:hypothetical protein
MRARARVFVTAAVMALAFVPLAPSSAQRAVISGTIFRDSAGHQVSGAELSLPALKRTATSNYRGEFKFDFVPPGRHAMIVRHAGFAPLIDTLDVADGERIDREYVLTAQGPPSDSAKNTVAAKAFISDALGEFGDRRRAGSGHFIGDEEMRQNDDRSLIDVISGRVPGLSRFIIDKRRGMEYIGSSRKCGTGPSMTTCKTPGSYCPVTLLVDGVVMYDASRSSEVPDLKRFVTKDFAAVEYYSGGASVPAKYNTTSSGCGVLLLWSRERE